MKNKKAELTTQQIVILIVLIMSFAVLLYFLFLLNPAESGEKEICHNSVVMKGNPVLSKGDVSLNCQRTYVCLSKDRSCESMTNPNIKKVETADEVYRVLADEMADCWWMFGEGEINYVGKDFKSNLYCSICSQIAFDDSVKKIEGIGEGIDEREFYLYLENNEISEGKSYLEYLLEVQKVEDIESSMTQEGGSLGVYDLDKQYFVMMGIFSEVGVWKWVVSGVGVTGGVALIAASIFTGGSSAIVGVGVIKAVLVGSAALAGGYAGSYVGTVAQGNSENDYLRPVILEANSPAFSAFNCKDIVSLA